MINMDKMLKQGLLTIHTDIQKLKNDNKISNLLDITQDRMVPLTDKEVDATTTNAMIYNIVKESTALL